MKYFVLSTIICFSTMYGYHVTLSHIPALTDFDALKQQIISHAEAIVTTTHALSHQAREIKNSTDFQNWINTNEPNCAIALLNECTSIGCKLSRLDGNNYKRSTFDQLAAERLVKVQHENETVNYVSFASGGGFTDLRILTLAHELGLKSVTIHLIDLSYASCINKLKSMRSHDIIPVLSASPYRAHSIKEFITYVTHLFGAGNVAVHIYGSGQEYLETIKTLGAYAPDLIIGVDFDPSKKTYKTCMHDFVKIIENGSAQALHLHGNGIFHIAPKNIPFSSSLNTDHRTSRYSKKLFNYALLF